ncbi:hypothetical protein GCM10027446_00630 [Angustibacter peucedani]
MDDDVAPPSARELLGRFGPSLAVAPALVTVVWGPRNVLVYQNAESERVLGRRPLGVPVLEAFPDYPPERWDRLEEVRTTGQPVAMPRTNVGLLDAHGDEMVLRYVMAPLGDGPPHEGVVLTAVDASAEARSQQAAVRAQLLGALTEAMTEATDPATALQTLTDALVPALADLAAVYVLDPAAAGDGQGEALPPAALSLSAGLLASAGPPPAPRQRSGPSPWDDSLAAGKTVVVDLDDELDPARADLTADDASRDWMAAAGARNVVVVPLVVAGRLNGALVLLSVAPRDRYRLDDAGFFEDVAARAGVAVSHARAFQRQQETALLLQRALLPAVPAPQPGLEVAVRYVAGSVGVEVGGDWWDVHHLGGGRVAVGVGDVSGRGVPAAVLMGQARSGMRALSHADVPPGTVLSLLDDQVADLVRPGAQDPGHRLPPRFATAVYAVIDPVADTLTVANAGHPPLMVRPSHDDRVVLVQAPPGPPLGLGVGGYEELVVPFPPGSLLVAFTDGLVEARGVDLDDGIAAAVAALTAIRRGTPVEEIATRLLALAAANDDTALIVLRRTPL